MYAPWSLLAPLRTEDILDHLVGPGGVGSRVGPISEGWDALAFAHPGDPVRTAVRSWAGFGECG